MPITQGLTNVGSIFIGETPIASVYQGTNLLYQSEITYKLLYELDVTTAATQIDIEDLNITKDDEVRLVYTIKGNTTADSYMSIYPNDLTTATNYHTQLFLGLGSSLVAVRQNLNRFTAHRSNGVSAGFADIKISNNDRFVLQSQSTRFIGSPSSSLENRNANCVGTQTVSSITKLSIVASATNEIGVGSKIQLYKVSRGTS